MSSPPYVKPSAAKIFKKVQQRYGEPHWPRPRNPAGILNEPFLAGLYRSEHDMLFEPRENQFYEYEDGIYHPVTTHIILDRLADRLREVAATYSQYAPLLELTSNRHLNGVIAHLKGQTQKEEAFANQEQLIHVANGVLDLDGSITLRPFSSQPISRNLIPIAYDPKAECPQFKRELLGLLDTDDQELLQKFLGLFLLGRNIVQKFLILHGLGETGKSTFTEVARKLIGEHNCAELRTNLLAERFEIGSYIGKNLLIGADVARSFLNSPGAYRLKALTGADLLDAERKGSNYRFQLAGHFNVIVTSNTRLTLRLEGDRLSWKRRLAIIEYEHPRSSKTIPDFAEVLIKSEGPGILRFGVEGFLKLQSDLKDGGRMKLSKKQDDRNDAFLDESDGLRLFLTNNLEAVQGYDLSSQEIVEEFAKYAIARGWSMNTRQTELALPDLMLELFGAAKSNSIKRGDPKKPTNVKGFRGVKFK